MKKIRIYRDKDKKEEDVRLLDKWLYEQMGLRWIKGGGVVSVIFLDDFSGFPLYDLRIFRISANIIFLIVNASPC